jgi:bleomycin hydrolase
MKKQLLFGVLLAGAVFTAEAQSNGGISAAMLEQLRASYTDNAADHARQNAISNNDIRKLVVNQANRGEVDAHFSHKVNSKGITNQQQSGRCWLFSGLNVLRARMIQHYDLGSFEFSQNYCFFWDQLEKSNLFLQGIIDTRTKAKDDQMVEWLFKNPLSDGGQFTGVADIVTKYGVVPKEVMPETYSSEHTSQMAKLLKQKLREYGLELRALSDGGAKPVQLASRKTEMLQTIYRILVLNLGEPPTHFTWTRRNAKDEEVDTREYTPLSFFETYVNDDLTGNYVMVMNDPVREYYKCYEIDYDRHVYDGHNWKYINLPIDDIKQMAIASIKDSTMMYFSCDVGKFLDSDRGLLDVDNYDYEALMGVPFPMNKEQRVASFDSGSSHAMTLMAVDLDADGKAKKWMVENSWGATSGYKGHLILTDRWFDEYMFRLVVDRKYVPQQVLDVLQQKPVKLPAWDPMFADEQ